MRGTSGRVGRWLVAVAAGWVAARAASLCARDVTGTSMLPALAPGDRLLVLPVPAGRLRRGDVVVVRDPRVTGRETVKRVVGLPGETVTVGGGRLVVDGVRFAEPYVARPGGAEVSVRVPAGHAVVLGDNRVASTDSRTYGPVALPMLVRRVTARIRPPGAAPHQAPIRQGGAVSGAGPRR